MLWHLTGFLSVTGFQWDTTSLFFVDKIRKVAIIFFSWQNFLFIFLTAVLSTLYFTAHSLFYHKDPYSFCYLPYLSYLFELKFQFYGPVNTVKVMPSKSVYLTTLLLDRLCPGKWWTGTCVHSFTWETDKYPPWINGRDRMTVENISW